MRNAIAGATKMVDALSCSGSMEERAGSLWLTFDIYFREPSSTVAESPELRHARGLMPASRDQLKQVSSDEWRHIADAWVLFLKECANDAGQHEVLSRQDYEHRQAIGRPSTVVPVAAAPQSLISVVLTEGVIGIYGPRALVRKRLSVLKTKSSLKDRRKFRSSVFEVNGGVMGCLYLRTLSQEVAQARVRAGLELRGGEKAMNTQLSHEERVAIFRFFGVTTEGILDTPQGASSK